MVIMTSRRLSSGDYVKYECFLVIALRLRVITRTVTGAIPRFSPGRRRFRLAGGTKCLLIVCDGEDYRPTYVLDVAVGYYYYYNCCCKVLP